MPDLDVKMERVGGEAMDEKKFQKWMEQVGALTQVQFKQMVQAYANGGGLTPYAFGAVRSILYRSKSRRNLAVALSGLRQKLHTLYRHSFGEKPFSLVCLSGSSPNGLE